MLVVGAAIASVFIFRLQPTIVTQTTQVTSEEGVTNIVMPPGVGARNDLNFYPANATVIIDHNNTIVWTNEDTASHTVYSKSVPPGAQAFHSGILAKGDKFNVTLTVPGVYVYYCSIHPAWMVARILVKGAPPASS